ncbi:MAG: GNAT family N-acetyltransferase [Burkholderiales bacterium]
MEIEQVGWGSPLMAKALELRKEVFVFEQGVPLELEIDEMDETAIHFVLLLEGEVAATLRLLPQDNCVKIGRVAVRKDFRSMGIGTLLMKRAIEHAIREGFPEAVLDAQHDSMRFYEKLGFSAEGEIFMDAGIPHKGMRLKFA